MFTAWNLLDLLALRSPNGSIPRNGDVCPCIPCNSSGDVSTYGGPQSFWMFILHICSKRKIEDLARTLLSRIKLATLFQNMHHPQAKNLFS